MSSVPCHLLEPAFMKKRLILGLLSVTALAATGLYAANAQHPATMLVLDASGSMWGQIGGKAKIAIAREAVDAMLDGTVAMIFNTTEGWQSLKDSSAIRTSALRQKVASFTTAAASVVAVDAIEALRGHALEVRALQSYYPLSHA